ncbi:MAG: GMC family oxidoreductase [Nocardioidaceae bacterium]
MNDSYDFVVVGAGSSGCALTRRLSDDPNVTVALVEAGGQPDRPEIAAPSDYYKLWGSEIDWNYRSLPEAGTAGRRHQLPRGRVLGGTSALNGMVYLRGDRADFDGWAREGCIGWDWESVLASYDELESQLLFPRIVTEPNELSEVFLIAAHEVGFRLNPSFDDGDIEGCGWNRLSIHQGRRHSSYRAFIEPVLGRPNLTVLSGTSAERLAISASGAVTGLDVVNGTGLRRSITAGEVIVSAGAYDTPRLLMMSGLGPADNLREHDIVPVVDLPVGDNLQDHLLVGVVYESLRPIDPRHAHITESCAFARSSADEVSPDIEISFNKESHFAPPVDDGVPRFTIIPGITRLKSRGTVRLAPQGSTDRLEIHHGYFAAAEDMAVMVEAVRRSRLIGEAPAFKDWSTGEYFPGPAVESDEQIARYVADHVSTWFHPAGTCRMGTGDDAVVGPDLRVRGTTGLRVADASVMPTVVTVNTNAASMMIGWNAASLALGQRPTQHLAGSEASEGST